MVSIYKLVPHSKTLVTICPPWCQIPTWTKGLIERLPDENTWNHLYPRCDTCLGLRCLVDESLLRSGRRVGCLL